MAKPTTPPAYDLLIQVRGERIRGPFLACSGRRVEITEVVWALRQMAEGLEGDFQEKARIAGIIYPGSQAMTPGLSEEPPYPFSLPQGAPPKSPETLSEPEEVDVQEVEALEEKADANARAQFETYDGE